MIAFRRKIITVENYHHGRNGYVFLLTMFAQPHFIIRCLYGTVRVVAQSVCSVAFIFFMTVSPSYAEMKHYVVEGRLNNNDYVGNLLRMILEASKAPDEVIDLKYNILYDQQIPHSRRIIEFNKLKDNLVIWTVTSQEREDFLRPIRVPVYKGLFGYRHLVIRREDKEKFAAIKMQKDLAKLVAGQGEHWPDTDILRANGISVLTGLAKENLYKMLAAKRFDFFPRSLIEIEPERKLFEEYDLMVEPHILLEYPNPMYFFVHKSNDELAGRLQRGWEKIINDGSFDVYFYSDPIVAGIVKELHEHSYDVFHLQNPDLPIETPIHDARYWLSPSLFHETSAKNP